MLRCSVEVLGPELPLQVKHKTVNVFPSRLSYRLTDRLVSPKWCEKFATCVRLDNGWMWVWVSERENESVCSRVREQESERESKRARENAREREHERERARDK